MTVGLIVASEGFRLEALKLYASSVVFPRIILSVAVGDIVELIDDWLYPSELFARPPGVMVEDCTRERLKLESLGLELVKGGLEIVGVGLKRVDSELELSSSWYQFAGSEVVIISLEDG